MTEPKQMTFVKAMMDFFGKKPDQTPVGFMAEIKALSPDERAWFADNLKTVGYEITAA